jgi:hypothetical protein
LRTAALRNGEARCHFGDRRSRGGLRVEELLAKSSKARMSIAAVGVLRIWRLGFGPREAPFRNPYVGAGEGRNRCEKLQRPRQAPAAVARLNTAMNRLASTTIF